MIAFNRKQFEQELTRELYTFERHVTDALYKTAAEATAEAKRTTLFKDQTGKLRKSVAWAPRSFFEVQLRATKNYASFVHNGTDPHRIEAKDGGRLAFMFNGRLVRPKAVNHPGSKARPFLQNAADAAEGRLARRIEQALRDSFS